MNETNETIEYVTECWGNHIFPNDVHWERLENLAGDSFLTSIGEIGVDSASVTVETIIRDLEGASQVRTKHRIQTPDGDGVYRVLAGKIKGIGRCLVVAFDEEQK